MAAKLCFRCKNVPSKWQNVEFEWRNDHLKISMRVAVIVGDSDGGIFFLWQYLSCIKYSEFHNGITKLQCINVVDDGSLN